MNNHKSKKEPEHSTIYELENGSETREIVDSKKKLKGIVSKEKKQNLFQRNGKFFRVFIILYSIEKEKNPLKGELTFDLVFFIVNMPSKHPPVDVIIFSFVIFFIQK